MEIMETLNLNQQFLCIIFSSLLIVFYIYYKYILFQGNFNGNNNSNNDFFFFLQLFFFKESDKLSQWKIFWPQKIKKVGPKFMYAKKLYIWNQERGGKEEEELESNYIISTNQRPLNNFKKCQKERKKLKIINYKL